MLLKCIHGCLLPARALMIMYRDLRHGYISVENGGVVEQFDAVAGVYHRPVVQHNGLLCECKRLLNLLLYKQNGHPLVMTQHVECSNKLFANNGRKPLE